MTIGQRLRYQDLWNPSLISLGKVLFQALYVVLSVSHAQFSWMIYYSLERKVLIDF